MLFEDRIHPVVFMLNTLLLFLSESHGRIRNVLKSDFRGDLYPQFGFSKRDLTELQFLEFRKESLGRGIEATTFMLEQIFGTGKE
jgi:hypothetical protein